MTSDEAMQAVYDAFHTPELAPGEFSTAMYRERFNLKRGQAEAEIRAGIDAGVLEYVGRRVGSAGKPCDAYRIKTPV